jgi:hypothetical protein
MWAKMRFLLIFSILSSASGCDLTSSNTAVMDTFPPVSGNALYVSARTGTSDGDGSNTKPFVTIGAALGKATSGAVIAIAAGDYAENLHVPGGVSLVGISTSLVRISGENGVGIAIAGSGETRINSVTVVGALGAGIAASEATLMLSGVNISGVTPDGQRPGDGVALTGVASADLRSCNIHDNAGTGVLATGCGPISIIDPLFSKDPRGVSATDPNAVGIIDPLFLPASLIQHNTGGGVAIIDPLFFPGADALHIQATDILANASFGVAVHGGNVSIDGSAIRGSLAASTKGAPSGDGLLIGSGTIAPTKPFKVNVTQSIITGNARAGVLLSGPAILSFRGESSLNGRGGLWAQDPAAQILTYEDALVARNTLVGIAVSNGASLIVQGSRIADTQEFVYTPTGATTTVSAADGIGVYTNAHGFITGAKLSGNARAAVLGKNCAANTNGAPDLTVENCSISGSKWGVVINGQYGMAAPSAGGTGSNSYDGVDAAKQSNNAELPAPESACDDGSYSCTP